MAEVVGNFMKQVGGFIDGAIDFTGLASVQEKIFALLNVVSAMCTCVWDIIFKCVYIYVYVYIVWLSQVAQCFSTA